MRAILWLVLALAATLPAAAQAAGFDPALVEQGRYMARAGDCVACHTAPGGKDFAGGLPIETPIGRIYSTNITPDPATGIGGYSFDAFSRAVRLGAAKDGHRLYPAMPFPSYALITDGDMKALYAYFMTGVPAVAQGNRDSDIPWPLDMRWPLAIWSLVYAPSQPFRPVAGHDAAWNRGAYLVEGLGHCGSCHTPRGLGFQEKALSPADGGDYLSGARIDGWLAKNLRGEQASGLGAWKAADIAQFLKSGRTDRSAVFASMGDVVDHSTQYLADDDLKAIAAFLKSLPPNDGTPPVAAAADGTTDALRAGDDSRPGAALYVEFCAACHRTDGQGASRIYPALAGNSVVASDDPASLIRIVLEGSRMPATASEPRALAMPGLANLSDREVAEVLTFVRSGWSNHAAPLAAADVARIRKTLPPPPAVAAPANPSALPFTPPRDTSIANEPNAAAILLGKRMITETKRLLPDKVGNGLNCTSCHLNEGKTPFASPFYGVAANFPQNNPRAGRMISLEDRINGCFLRSMNGKAVPVDSPEMKAILAYFNGLSAKLPAKALVQGHGAGKVDTSLVPNPANGKVVYDDKCASCHGANGEGRKDARGAYVFPPLWGNDSFNIGAGMARTFTAAAFVKNNMPVAFGLNGPLGQGGALTDQEAMDVAEYFTHQPRPDFAAKVNDWPNGGKPKDARY